MRRRSSARRAAKHARKNSRRRQEQGRGSWLPLLAVSGLAFGDFLSQPLELAAVEHGVVHHADDQLLGGAAAEAVNNVLYGAHGHVLARLGSAINVGPAA